MTKIVGLNGAPVFDMRKSSPEAIKLAEWLLEAAKSGEINGIACVVHGADGVTTTQSMAGAMTVGLIGRMEILKQMAMNAIMSR